MAATRGKQAEDAPYQVVARRFRPQTFQEVVGQDEVLQSLRLALRDQRVPHAFLFSGSRGVGKTTSARILARCLNCEQGPTAEPCGTCDLCRSILDGSNPDVIEIDAASNNGVADVRQLIDHVGFATMRSRYRVVILDEAHMLSKAAFNALLKTLEEPPPQVVFVLATTELHKLPETIRSRCQVLLFRRVGDEDLKKRLQMIAAREKVEVADEVLDEIAASVRGGVRDAETALERVLPLLREQGKKFDRDAYRLMVARVGADASVEVVASLLQGDARRALHFARELQQNGTDEREALGELVETLRWLLLLHVDGPDSGLVPISGALRQRLQELAAAAVPHQLDAMVSAGVLGRERLRRLEDRGVVLEVALVRMAQAALLPSVADLLAEVRAGGGAAVAAAARSPVPSAPPPSRPAAAPPSASPPASHSSPPRAAAPTPSTPPADAADLRARTLALLQDRALLHASVEQCRFDGPDGKGRVVLTLQSDRKMHQDRLQSPVIQTELTNIVRIAAVADVTVEFRIGEAPGGSAAGAPPSSAKAEPGPAATRVVKKFRGRVVQVNPEDRRRDAPRPTDDGDVAEDVQPPDLQE
jgi:DNA polymerase-3 subunit gamma/tau